MVAAAAVVVLIFGEETVGELNEKKELDLVTVVALAVRFALARGAAGAGDVPNEKNDFD